MKKLRAGIIGTGMATGISHAHYTGYQKSETAYVAAVYNEPPELADAWCKKYGITDVKLCRSLEEFFENVDIVSICTPNFTHADYVKKCLKAGKHVLCEKPVGAGSESLAGLEKACGEAKVLQMIDFNYRKIPGIRFLREMCEQGVFGDIVVYRHTMGGGRLADEQIGFEWRMDRRASGSGSLGDFGSHIIDTMLFITGRVPEDVHCEHSIEKTQIRERIYNGKPRAVENDDCAIVQGVLGRETMFTFLTSRVGGLGNRLEIIGTRGIASFCMDRPYEILLEVRKPGSGFSGEMQVCTAEEKDIEHFFREETKTTIAACSCNVADFAKRAKEGSLPDTPLIYGIQVERLLDEMDKKAISL